MGLFSKDKAKKIIEFSDSNDTLFRLIDCTTGYSSDTELIVNETQYAFIVADGVMSDVLPAGRHKIFQKGGFLNLQKAHRSVKAIYISKTAKVSVKWGTPPHLRIKYQDPKIGMPIDVGAFGTMEFQVSEPKQFYLEIIANFGDSFTLNDLQERIRLKSVDRVAGAVRRMISEKQLSYYDFDANKEVLQYELLGELRDVFLSYVGLRVCEFFVENLSVTEENEKKIREKYQKAQDEVEYDENRALEKKHEQDRREDARDKREWELEQDRWQKEDIDRDLRFQRHIAENEEFVYNRDKMRQRDEIDYKRKNAIEDEERHHQWEKEDADRAERVAVAGMRYDAVKEAGWENAPKKEQDEKNAYISSAGRHCRVCGNPYGSEDMFCPVCGAVTDNNKQEIPCPECKTMTSVKNTFCPACGAKMKP